MQNIFALNGSLKRKEKQSLDIDGLTDTINTSEGLTIPHNNSRLTDTTIINYTR